MKTKTSKTKQSKSKKIAIIPEQDTFRLQKRRGRPPKRKQDDIDADEVLQEQLQELGHLKDKVIEVSKKEDKKKYYVDTKRLEFLIEEYYNDDKLVDELAVALYNIAYRISFMPNFINYCVDAETEALTKRGWLKYNEINKKDEILSYNIKSKQLEWSKIKSIYQNTFKGEMHYLRGKGLNALVTPEHKFVTTDGLKKVENLKRDDVLVLMPPHTLKVKNIDFDKISCNDIIWCPETEFGTFVCKRKNQMYITGNSWKEEMIGDGLIKELFALKNKKYDPDKGRAFSYFSMIVYNAFCNRIKKENRFNEVIKEYQAEQYDTLIVEQGGNPNVVNTSAEEEDD